MTSIPVAILTTWLVFVSVQTSNPSWQSLPPEPDETTRIDEIYDQESRLFLSLYSLKGDGEVDYVTGRTVQGHVDLLFLCRPPYG